MSVIQVRNEGPDWRAQALVNFLGPLIGDAIKQQQQRDYNRKRNALYGKTLEDIAAMSGSGQTLTPSLASTGNAWADALQQSGNSALGQFDAGTAGIAPQMPAPAQPSTGSLTQEQILKAMAANMANPRFSHMNTADMIEGFAPYLAASENARQENLRRELAEAVFNSPNAAGRLGELWKGVIEGLVPYSALDQAQRQNEYENPYPEAYSFNTGEKTIYGNRNKRTGEYTQAGEFTNTLTPQQQAELQRYYDGLDWEREKFGMPREDDRYKFDTGVDLQRDQQKTQREGMRQIFPAGDGKLYWRNPDGSVTPVIVGDKHLDAPQGSEAGAGWNKGDDAFIGGIDNEIEEIKDEIKRHEDARMEADKEEKREFHSAEIAKLRQQLAQLRELRQAYVVGRISPRKRESSTQTTPDRNTQQAQPSTANPQAEQQQDKGSVLPPTIQNTPTNTPQSQQAQKDNSPITWRNETTGEIFTLNQYQGLVQRAINGEVDGMHTQEEVDRELERRGYKRNQTNTDMQANNPIWRTKDGRPAMLPSGKILTNEFYEENVRRIENGEVSSLHSREDLDRYYEQHGFVKGTGSIKQDVTIANSNSNIDWRPSHQRGFENPVASGQNNQGAEQPQSQETPTMPFLTDKEKQEMDETLNGRIPEPRPVDTTVQARNPNSDLDMTKMQLTSNIRRSTIDNPFPDAPEGQYTLEERVGQMADHLASSEPYQDIFGTSNGNQHVFPRNVEGRLNTIPDAERKFTTPQEMAEYITNYDNVPLRQQPFFEDLSETANINNSNEAYELAANRRRRSRSRQPISRGQTAIAQTINRRAANFENMINTSTRRHGVPPELVKAVIMTESGFNPNAHSKVGATGLMQLMPKTARGLGVRNSLDPAQNIEGGTKYLGQMLRMFKGDIQKALWAYNAGPGNAKKGRLPKETRAYIPRVMSYYNALRGAAPARKAQKTQRKNLSYNPSVTPTEQSSLNTLNGYHRASDTTPQIQDNSPVAWQSGNGQNVLTSNMYEELVKRAENGEIEGYVSREDVDEYLNSSLGLKNVAQAPAPEYTDAVNGTTAAGLQDLENELNGIADDRYSQYPKEIQGAMRDLDQTMGLYFSDYNSRTRPYRGIPGTTDFVNYYTPEESAMASILPHDEFQKWIEEKRWNEAYSRWKEADEEYWRNWNNGNRDGGMRLL